MVKHICVLVSSNILGFEDPHTGPWTLHSCLGCPGKEKCRLEWLLFYVIIIYFIIIYFIFVKWTQLCIEKLSQCP